MQDRAGLVSFIETRMRVDRVPGLAVAVIIDDQVRWLRGFGVADLGNGTPVGPSTAFLWFSMTKVVTATAVMQLVDEGRLGLDDPVNRYYAPFTVVRQPTLVTVRHLLSHSSGLANPIPLRWVHPADAPEPHHATLVQRLLTRYVRLSFRPGDRARYSNLGYLVLGEVIAQVAGSTYEDYVRQRILAPLGMTHTGFSYGETGTSPAAVGYQRLAPALTPVLRALLPPGLVASTTGKQAACGCSRPRPPPPCKASAPVADLSTSGSAGSAATAPIHGPTTSNTSVVAAASSTCCGCTQTGHWESC
jgi:CubicO group peptidase (beta-lactamase class C family)